MTAAEITREQDVALERLCLEHGDCQVVTVTRAPLGRCLSVRCHDNFCCFVTEDGLVKDAGGR